MKPILLFGITLLIFPEQAWPQDSVSKPPLIHSVCIQPGYRFAGNNGSLTGFRPEAEMSHHYRITDYGYLSACINLVPARKMTVTLAAQVSSFKATEQYLFGFVEPMNFEVSFDQLAFYLSADYLFSHGWKFLMAGQLLSGVQPLMVWQEQPLGGEFVAAPNPYRDWLFYGAASKRAGRLNLEVSGGYAKFRAKPAGQAGLRLQADLSRNGITLVEGSATWVADTLDPKGRLVFLAGAEQKLFGPIRMGIYFSEGLMQNMSVNSGLTVYNLFDPVRRRAGITLSTSKLTRNLDLSLTYEWSQRTANWYLYQSGDFTGTAKKDYSFHSLTGGIFWKF